MFLSTVAVIKNKTGVETIPLLKAVRDGMGIAESSIIFSISPLNSSLSGHHPTVPTNGSSGVFKTHGDVFIVKAVCLDMALWKIGGAAVALRLVQVASVSESRAFFLSFEIHITFDLYRHRMRSRVR